MQRSPSTFLYAALLSAALAAPVLAQQQPPASQTPSPMQAPAVPQPSDQQLQRFASASQKVSGVVDEYRPKVESAKTDEAKQKLVKEADEKMVQLVRADGLTVDEFNGISRAVQQDPQLQQRVSKLNPSGKTR
ncbi:DUF4168 domain-containing protein [Achromobacter sp. AONIH1]|uniref:DUF4168 domain-containing protein n=1 Tax=unclassified Achromobacter TaxID=2626865 RepID=UPI000CD046AC|nr:DUF4168 domain-containing protein [Achromobacter sp. AONIH1]AUT47426.1 hypothetical protein C2U31_16395 [Achromobacter sp. AONIH1]